MVSMYYTFLNDINFHCCTITIYILIEFKFHLFVKYVHWNKEYELYNDCELYNIYIIYYSISTRSSFSRGLFPIVIVIDKVSSKRQLPTQLASSMDRRAGAFHEYLLIMWFQKRWERQTPAWLPRTALPLLLPEQFRGAIRRVLSPTSTIGQLPSVTNMIITNALFIYARVIWLYADAILHVIPNTQHS